LGLEDYIPDQTKICPLAKGAGFRSRVPVRASPAPAPLPAARPVYAGVRTRRLPVPLKSGDARQRAFCGRPVDSRSSSRKATAIRPPARGTTKCGAAERDLLWLRFYLLRQPCCSATKPR
jgi:hypothetical protein